MRTLLIIILVISAVGILIMCSDMCLTLNEAILCAVLLMAASFSMDALKL